MDNAIKEFIMEIKRGPFKCLRDYEGEAASEYIAAQNADVGDIYDCAVYQAWLDMCRTVSATGKTDKNLYEEARKDAADSLRQYFIGKPKTKADAFDNWFRSACFEIGAPAKLTVGQEQKILNMTFKYLYCCKDIRNKYEKHFTCCHMPLDSYTLNWYKDECNSRGYHGEAWSLLNDVSLYSSIQQHIRETLVGRNVLVEEFSIWQREKVEAEKKALKSSVKKIMDFEGCSKELKDELTKFVDSLV